MAVKGSFTVPAKEGYASSSESERTYKYETEYWIATGDPFDREHQKHDINSGDLDDVDSMTVKITDSDGNDDYRVVYGPFFEQEQIEEILTSYLVYGSE